MMLTIENIAAIAYASNDKTKEASRVVEPSGKTYRIYADGQIDGFSLGRLYLIIFRRSWRRTA